MHCLSCEQAIDGTGRVYHSACARHLFGASTIPRVVFSYADLPVEARKLVGKMSISGVQPKLPVAIRRGMLEVTASGGTHILKPTPEAFPFLSENENMCMAMALAMGNATPPHGLVRMTDNRLAYLIRRFDRSKGGQKIHVEDFAQLLEKSDKYDGSVEQIGKFLKTHSSIPFIDTQKLFSAILCCFLIGNGDAHLKNFAMIRTPSGYRLSPLYDMVSSRLAMPSESDEMAIAINGRRNRIDRRDFEALADYLEIQDTQRRRIFASARMIHTNVGMLAGHSFLPAALKKEFVALFGERSGRLFR